MKIWVSSAIVALAVAGVVCCASSAYSYELQGKVVAVSDGDTITILSRNEESKVRLADIDCPERKQPFGQKARTFCAQLCFSKEVKVTFSKRDRYKRIVGYVELPDGRILNIELLKAGMAWCYTKYCKDESMAEFERQARNAKIGLWTDTNAISPWQWRDENQKRGRTDGIR